LAYAWLLAFGVVAQLVGYRNGKRITVSMGRGAREYFAAGQKHAHIYKQSNLTGATSGQGANVDVYKKLNLVTQHKRVQEPLSRCLLKAGTVDR